MSTPRPQPSVALYVHVPFCLSICPYCDFVVYGGSAARGPDNRIESVVGAIETEIRLRAPHHRRQALNSVYLGGGTPSLLAADQVGRLLAAVDRGFGITDGAEITLECNPGPADRGDLAGFRAAGVNRLSIGAQSMNLAELHALGRRHSPEDVRATVAQARTAGFDNLSLDLLYDVPGQTLESWRTSLESAVALKPEHVSAYALTLDDPEGEGLTGPTGDHLPLRAGARRWRGRAAALQDEAFAADSYALADDLLTAAGYGWYEISNWARPDRESRHNLVYWSGGTYEAVGPGAHAFDGALSRRWNAARLDGYVAALGRDELPPGSQDVADPPTAAAEAAILRLRTSAGLPPALARLPAFASGLAWGVGQGLLESTPGHGFRLTRAGRLVSNELFVRLLPEPASRAA